MVLLQSMNKHNVFEKSEETSLTIGDLSSLFSQQIEDDNREGVHSPDEDDESSQELQGRSDDGQDQSSQPMDQSNDSDDVDTVISCESSNVINEGDSNSGQSDGVDQGENTQQEEHVTGNSSTISGMVTGCDSASNELNVPSEPQSEESQHSAEVLNLDQTSKKTENSYFCKIIGTSSGCEPSHTLNLPSGSQYEPNLSHLESKVQGQSVDQMMISNRIDSVDTNSGHRSSCTSVNDQSLIELNHTESEVLGQGQIMDQTEVSNQRINLINETEVLAEMVVPTQPEISEGLGDSGAGDSNKSTDEIILLNTESNCMNSDHPVMPGCGDGNSMSTSDSTKNL